MLSNDLVCLEVPLFGHVYITDFILKGGWVFLGPQIEDSYQVSKFPKKKFYLDFYLTQAYVNP